MINEGKKPLIPGESLDETLKLCSQFVYVLSLPTVAETLEGHLSGVSVKTLVVFYTSHGSKM